MPLLDKPLPPSSRSPRFRVRFRRRLQFWKIANGYLKSLNQCYEGFSAEHSAPRQERQVEAEVAEVWKLIHADALSRAKRFAEERRGSPGLTGVHAASALLGAETSGSYGLHRHKITRVDFVADRMDEPTSSSPTVMMLIRYI